MRRFVAVDVETTGLDPMVHELIEVGLVVETNDGGISEQQFSVPFDENKADERALVVNGWGKREFAPKVDPAWLSGHLAEALRDAHLVAKNPQFDAAFLAGFLGRYGIEPTWHHRLVDIGALVWGYHSASMLDDDRADLVFPQPPNVVDAARLIGVPMPPGDQHTALGDARWAYQAFRACVPQHVGVRA